MTVPIETIRACAKQLRIMANDVRLAGDVPLVAHRMCLTCCGNSTQPKPAPEPSGTLIGDGGFGGKPTKLECVGCTSVEEWEKASGV